MVVANTGWIPNVNYCLTNNDNNINLNVDKSKMSAKCILICRDNSHTFQDRTLILDQAIKIGRSVARTKSAVDNAIFDCKVLSRNHALLWYNGGKFYLRDTRSSNGTFVNNQRLSITGSESTAKEVCSGDIVQFGVDVVESTKKVTHGCIIATLKLYLPDGKEAKASSSMCITSSASDVNLEDLYKLNQHVQEANRLEKVLHSKLTYLQKIVANTRKVASQSWEALIDEDRLLSRVKTVESQLVIYSKNYTEDKIRGELITLEEEKSHYQIAAKEALQRVHQEKLEATQKLIQLESRLNETEEECQSLHEISKHAQMELQQLATKYTNVQKNLAQCEEKLAKQEQSSTEIAKWTVQEKQDLVKRIKDQSIIGRQLQCKLNENRLDSLKIHKKLAGLRSYIQTFHYINTKLLPDESKDSANPIEVINAILDTVNEMIAETDNINDIEQFESLDNVGNIFDIEENPNIKLYDIELNEKKIILRSDERSSYDNNEHDNSYDDLENITPYILPPIRTRRTIINDHTNINDDNEKQNFNSDTNNDQCNIMSDGDKSNFIRCDDANEKSIIENKLAVAENNTNLFAHPDIADKYQVKFSDNVNDDYTENHYYNLLDINNSSDSDDTLDPSLSSNESISIIDPTIKNHNNITIDQINHDSINELFQCDDISIEDNNVKLNMREGKQVKYVDKQLRDKINAEEKSKDNKLDEMKMIDNNDFTIDNTKILVKNDNENNDETKDDVNYVKTLKPFVKNNENISQYSSIRDYILQLFINTLESLNSNDDNIEAQQCVNRELDELKNWLVHESNDVIIEKLITSYYRAKNDNTRILEMSEELVILKEKYSACHDDKTDICRKYSILKAQCGDVLNASYCIPIQYFVPVLVALLWMLFEYIF